MWRRLRSTEEKSCMSNISKAFDHGKALIPFFTCGDPELEITNECIHAAVEAGADMIELGIPFSDPTAEGPVIMNSSKRALENGVTTDKIFNMVRELRRDISVPMVFMTYANVLFSYGAEEFVKLAKEIEIDGFILPDIPFEEKGEFSGVCYKHDRDLISMIAPTSKDRISKIASDANGFLYCVSSLGVTGTRITINADVESMVFVAKQTKDIPCAVGFGISTPEQAASIAAVADGVIMGSVLMKLIEKHGRKYANYVGRFLKEIKAVI